MIASTMIIASSASNNNTICGRLPCTTSANEITDNRISSMICGMINGNPRIAIMAAFCCARAAIAARNVNTRLRLKAPRHTMPANCHGCNNTSPNNNLNSTRLTRLITIMSTALKNNFAMIKLTAPQME